MTCKKCETLLKQLIDLEKPYRHSYNVNGVRDALMVVEASSLEPIRQRDSACLSGNKNSTDERAETRAKR